MLFFNCLENGLMLYGIFNFFLELTASCGPCSKSVQHRSAPSFLMPFYCMDIPSFTQPLFPWWIILPVVPSQIMPSKPTWAYVSSLSKAAFCMINSKRYNFWVKGQICFKCNWYCQIILQKRYCKFQLQLGTPFHLHPPKHWVPAIWLTFTNFKRETISHFLLTCIVLIVAEVAHLFMLSLPRISSSAHCLFIALVCPSYFSFLLICSSSLYIINVNLLSIMYV